MHRKYENLRSLQLLCKCLIVCVRHIIETFEPLIQELANFYAGKASTILRIGFSEWLVLSYNG